MDEHPLDAARGIGLGVLLGCVLLAIMLAGVRFLILGIRHVIG